MELKSTRQLRCAALIQREETRLVSFDLFDTLISRQVFAPKDIFFRVKRDPCFPKSAAGFDFPRARIDAEYQLRKRWERQGHRADPTLDEIYHELCGSSLLDFELINEIKALECEAEIRTARSRPAVKMLYDFARANGKQTVICTDMYLPRETVNAILAQCGYDDDALIFLSSECGYTKKHGTMFNFVAKQYGLKPSECVHFGDNPRSDVDMAERNGWRAMKIWSLHDMFTEKNGVLADLVPAFRSERDVPCRASKANYQLIAKRFFSNSISAECAAERSLTASDFGHAALGPFLLSLTLWMLRLARQKGIDQLVFLARDGHLPIQAARRLREATGDATRLSYLPISRRALFPYFLTQPGGLERVLSVRYDPRQTVTRFITERFGSTGLEIFETRACGAIGSVRTALMSDHHDYVCGLLRDAEAILKTEAAEDAKNLVEYYRSALPSDAQLAVFDVGRKGTFQSVLGHITGRAMHGFYIVTDYEIIENAPGRAFDSFLGMIDKRAQVKTPDTILYEVLLSEKGGSYTGFDTYGEPRREDTTSTLDERIFIDALHKGALSFVDEAIEVYGTQVGELEQESFYAAYALENWTNNTAAVSLLSSVRHEDSISTPEARSLKDYFLERPTLDHRTIFPPRDSRKRVMIYCPAMTRIKGGAERIAARVANYLSHENYEVLIATSGSSRDTQKPVYDLEPGVLLRNLNMRDVDDISHVVKAFNPDCGLILASGLPVVRISLAFLHNCVPYLLSERANPINSFESYWKNTSFDDYTSVYEAANIASVQFDSFRDCFPEHMRKRVEILPNPIELFQSETALREKVIICAARIWFEQKRQDLLLRAFAEVAGGFPEWRLSFYGAAKGADGDKLRELADELNVADRVDINDAVEDIHDRFVKASVFALPSAFEGFPNALAEALSAGTPAVGFASCPGTNELIVDGENGFLVDDSDLSTVSWKGARSEPTCAKFIEDQRVARLAVALARVLDDAAWRDRASKAARASMAKYDEAKMNIRWGDAVARLCDMDGALYARQRATAVERVINLIDGRASGVLGEVVPAKATSRGHRQDYKSAVEFLRTAQISYAARAHLFFRKRFKGNDHDDVLFDALLAPRGNVVLPIPADFDESEYLKGNPDVAQAVAAGTLQSGYAHFVRHGQAEGRKRPTRR